MDPALIRQYRCVTCSFTSNVFPEIIDHNIINHPESELKIKVYLSDKKIVTYQKLWYRARKTPKQWILYSQ
jgi:predicted nucleic acid-binding Zn ribbon protein